MKELIHDLSLTEYFERLHDLLVDEVNEVYASLAFFLTPGLDIEKLSAMGGHSGVLGLVNGDKELLEWITKMSISAAYDSAPFFVTEMSKHDGVDLEQVEKRLRHYKERWGLVLFSNTKRGQFMLV